MTDESPPLTHEEKIRALRLATNSMEGAPRRWAERVAKGQTDKQLAEAVAYELGSFGGSARDNIGVTYQGSGLKIWADRCIGSRTRPPILEGQATLRLARAVYGILNPDEQQMGLF